jgi:hypothetical protein
VQPHADPATIFRARKALSLSVLHGRFVLASYLVLTRQVPLAAAIAAIRDLLEPPQVGKPFRPGLCEKPGFSQARTQLSSLARHLVPLRGFEPRLTASKAIVLPLDDRGLARSAGLEPATSGFGIRCSIRLSYERRGGHLFGHASTYS